MNVDDEQKTIAKIKAGDKNSYADLVEAYKNPVYNLIYRMTGDAADAEDVAQQVFLKAYQSLDRFDPQRRFFPWLYTIALNLVRNHLKKQRRLACEENAPRTDPPAAGNPERLYEARQAAEIIFKGVQRLPMKLRETIVLRYYQDLTYRQIAELLDISVSAAKMRAHRGLKTLARQLKAEDAVEPKQQNDTEQ